ncbi:MAG: hypothetical protein LPK85_10465 [Gammaproteobacteria bacterium]|nr:hypothetical protein [Gammaproteobacteria bacterium]
MSAIEVISGHIQDYLARRRFTGDHLHCDQLARLKQWQAQRLRQTYTALLQSPRHHALVSYFLEDIYNGLDLHEAASTLDKSLRLASRLLSDMRLIELALAFNALNAELDEQLAHVLFVEMGCESLSEERYAQACQRLNRIEDQQLALALVEAFAEGLEDVIHDPGVYRAFRLARIPVRMSSLRGLYDLIERGFDVMRALPDAEQTIQRIVRHEQHILQRIQEVDPAPFRPLVCQ